MFHICEVHVELWSHVEHELQSSGKHFKWVLHTHSPLLSSPSIGIGSQLPTDKG